MNAKPTVRRILVALDGSSSSYAALDAAAGAAELLGAELYGLYVEDINLLHVAQLSFVWEVGFTDAKIHEVDVVRMERHWDVQSTEAKRRLLELAGKKGLKWSFGVARGSVTQRILSAAAVMDLLAVGRLGRTIAQKKGLGTTARGLLEQSHCSLLLLKEAVDFDRPIIILVDGSNTSRLALSTAATLARRSGALRVLVWIADSDMAQRFKAEVVDQLPEQDFEVSFRRFYADDADRVLRMLQASQRSLLVIGVDRPHLSSPMLQSLIERLEQPLLVIR